MCRVRVRHRHSRQPGELRKGGLCRTDYSFSVQLRRRLEGHRQIEVEDRDRAPLRLLYCQRWVVSGLFVVVKRLGRNFGVRQVSGGGEGPGGRKEAETVITRIARKRMAPESTTIVQTTSKPFSHTHKPPVRYLGLKLCDRVHFTTQAHTTCSMKFQFSRRRYTS